jgi:CubicO group peptidase (beta-lactamase class C family)
VLAEAIARLTGMPYPEAMRRRVLAPLGMHDTTFDPRPMRSRVMTMHGIPIRNRLVQAMILRFLAGATMPGGGLFGTVEDLLRFGRALLPASRAPGPRILSWALIEEMTREQTAGVLEHLEDGTTREPRYGLGWGKPSPFGLPPSVLGPPVETSVRVPASTSTFTHGGACGSRIWVDPERDLVFAFLTNEWGVSDAPMYAVLAEVYRAWDDRD